MSTSEDVIADYPISIVEGSDFGFQFTWYDVKSATTEAAFDLTGYEASMKIGSADSDSTPALLLATTQTGEITLGDTAGTVAIVIPQNVHSAALPYGTNNDLFWSLTFTLTGIGFTHKLMKGRCTLIPTV